MEIQPSTMWCALERIGRAKAPLRKASKLKLAILPRQMRERLLELKADADDLGRKPHRFRHARWRGNRIGRRLGDDVKIGNDPGLTGVNHVAAVVSTAEYLAIHQTHPAGPANAATAIVRQLDAARQRAIEQEITAIGKKRLVVEGYFADLC